MDERDLVLRVGKPGLTTTQDVHAYLEPFVARFVRNMLSRDLWNTTVKPNRLLQTLPLLPDESITTRRFTADLIARIAALLAQNPPTDHSHRETQLAHPTDCGRR